MACVNDLNSVAYDVAYCHGHGLEVPLSLTRELASLALRLWFCARESPSLLPEAGIPATCEDIHEQEVVTTKDAVTEAPLETSFLITDPLDESDQIVVSSWTPARGDDGGDLPFISHPSAPLPPISVYTATWLGAVRRKLDTMRI